MARAGLRPLGAANLGSLPVFAGRRSCLVAGRGMLGTSGQGSFDSRRLGRHLGRAMSGWRLGLRVSVPGVQLQYLDCPDYLVGPWIGGVRLSWVVEVVEMELVLVVEIPIQC
jgi:hypothetical protein